MKETKNGMGRVPVGQNAQEQQETWKNSSQRIRADQELRSEARVKTSPQRHRFDPVRNRALLIGQPLAEPAIGEGGQSDAEDDREHGRADAPIMSI